MCLGSETRATSRACVVMHWHGLGTSGEGGKGIGAYRAEGSPLEH